MPSKRMKNIKTQQQDKDREKLRPRGLKNLEEVSSTVLEATTRNVKG